MRRRVEEFMRGRYGTDELAKGMLAGCLGLLVLNLFTGVEFIYLMAIALLILCYYRMFSRNIARRSEENRSYLQKTEGIRRSFAKMRSRIVQSREFHIYKCPSCGQKIRIPRGKGKICVTCPKCGKEFEKRS